MLPLNLLCTSVKAMMSEHNVDSMLLPREVYMTAGVIYNQNLSNSNNKEKKVKLVFPGMAQRTNLES